MKKIKTLVLVLVVIVVSSCSSVRSTKNENANLNKYVSYALTTNENNFLPEVSATNKRHIEEAINNQISLMSPANLGVAGPDVLINYFVIVDTKQDIDTYTTYYGRRWRNQIIQVDVRNYKEGTLILDFVDSKTKEVIWNASVSGTVTSDTISLKKKIDEAVKELFDKYKKDQIGKN